MRMLSVMFLMLMVLDMNILNMDFYRQMCTFITLDG